MPRNEELIKTAGDWLYVSCSCIVEWRTQGVTVTHEGGICQLCGNNNVLFVHTLEYIPDLDEGKPYPRQIGVGIDCARLLVDADSEHIPTLAENETKRKKKWRLHYRRPGRCSTTVDDLDARGKLW
jgi:hypothetical protein